MRMDPLEAKPSMPLIRGRCDWCGDKTKIGRTYCGTDCRVQYRNLITRQGKSMMQMLKIWRLHRGRKGTRGEGMIGEITERLDKILAEDRQRKKNLAK